MACRHPHLQVSRIVNVTFVLILLSFTHVSVGDALSVAPDFTLTDIDGNTFTLSQYHGQVVVLEFFTTVCGRCLEEIPHLKELINEFGSSIVILSISPRVEDTEEALREYRDEHNIPWIIAKDTIALYKTYNAEAWPTIYLIDQHRYIRSQHVGLIEASILEAEIYEILVFSLTITTSPNLVDVHFQVDGRDYFTNTKGNKTIDLQFGQHTIELVETVIEGVEGVEYHFSGWNGVYSGSENPITIDVTSTSILETIFEIQDSIPPTADAGLDRVINEDSLCTFEGNGSTDNVGISSYTWTFHDNALQTLTGVTPTYTFNTPGNYIVTLNVSDIAGNWDTDTIVITVNDITPPLAKAGGNQTVYRDTPMDLDASTSTDNVGIISYVWSFPDDPAQTLTGVKVSYTFSTLGEYTVTLNVSDAAGNWAIDTSVITVVDESEYILNAGMDQIVDEDTLVTFNGSASWDPEGHATYTWAFIDDVPQTLHGRISTYRFANPGQYTITLTVKDPKGTNVSDTVQITVRDLTPPIGQAGSDQVVDIGVLVMVSAENSTDNGEIVQYHWDFGDGTAGSGVTSNYSYTEPGNYTITLTIEDKAGNIDTDQMIVIVLPHSKAQHIFSINDANHQTTQVIIISNSSVSTFTHHKANASLTFQVEGVTATIGFCYLTVPIELLGSSYQVFVDDTPVTGLETRNSTHTFLFFTYIHSSHTITILGTEVLEMAPNAVIFKGAGTIRSGIPSVLCVWFDRMGTPTIMLSTAIITLLIGTTQHTVSTRKRTLFSLIIIGITLATILGGYILTANTDEKINAENLAPNFALTDLDGHHFTLSDYRGKSVIIEFMSPRCMGCQEQIPHLADVWEKASYQEKLMLITINIDPTLSIESLRAFREEYSYATWIWATDTIEEQVAQTYEVTTIPHLVIINPDGVVTFTHSEVTSPSILMEEIDQILISDGRNVIGPSLGTENLSGLSLIFTAGVLALLSPCGFPMLPGYISYYLGSKASVERTVTGGIACTLGLITVFSIIGVSVALIGDLIAQYIPLLELGAGILSIGMGLSMIVGLKLPTLFTIAKAPSQKGVLGIFLYGIAYGLATLGCSAPIFFSTLFYAIATGGVLQGVLTFLVYALGMGIPIIITTILIAKAKQLMISRIMQWMPWFQKLSSLILITIGIYLITYYALA